MIFRILLYLIFVFYIPEYCHMAARNVLKLIVVA